MRPTVSVIVPVYNRTAYLKEAIDSVLAQTYKHYEIIVVDDGSTTDVLIFLKPYGDKIKYVRQDNKGLASARNTGARNSQGEYIAFLDDDDLFTMKKLENQSDILQKKTDVAMVYSDEFMMINGKVSESPARADRKPPLPSGFVAKDFFCDSFIGVMTVLMRRSVFEEMGGFDENLLANEDDDLWFRVMLKHKVVCSDYVSGIRRIHGTNMSGDRNKMTYYQLLCISKYIDYCPDFILENYDAVKLRIWSLLSFYIRWEFKKLSFPRLNVLMLYIQITKRLNGLTHAGSVR